MKHLDIDGKVLISGDVIDIQQTVNGYNLFLIKSIEPLDIRYDFDHNRCYEYDAEELIKPSPHDWPYGEFKIINR